MEDFKNYFLMMKYGKNHKYIIGLTLMYVLLSIICILTGTVDDYESVGVVVFNLLGSFFLWDKFMDSMHSLDYVKASPKSWCWYVRGRTFFCIIYGLFSYSAIWLIYARYKINGLDEINIRYMCAIFVVCYGLSIGIKMLFRKSAWGVFLSLILILLMVFVGKFVGKFVLDTFKFDGETIIYILAGYVGIVFDTVVAYLGSRLSYKKAGFKSMLNVR